MPVKLKPITSSNRLHVRVTGKLESEDYDRWVPAVKKLFDACGKIDMLVEMIEFEGWTLSALWADLKFDTEYGDCIRAIAFVGDKKWEEWMAQVCQPFLSAAVRYFDHGDIKEAETWLNEPLGKAGD